MEILVSEFFIFEKFVNGRRYRKKYICEEVLGERRRYMYIDIISLYSNL